MGTESSTPPSGRPRPWLLVALGAAVVLVLLSTFMAGKSATPSAPASNRRASGRVAKNVDNVQPGDLVIVVRDCALRPIDLVTLHETPAGRDSTEVDCADATVGSCQYCADEGSCSTTDCPGTINPANNAVCG